MAGMEFYTAVEEHEDEKQERPRSITFTVGQKKGGEVVESREVTAYPPRDGQVTLMMAQLSRHSTDRDKAAGVIDFFASLFDKDDQDYFVSRLMDKDDRFGIDDVVEITKAMVEQWGKGRSGK